MDYMSTHIHNTGRAPLGAGTGGFTLVELLIAMGLAAVVAVAGLSLYSSTNWSYKVQSEISEAQQNARVAVDRLAKDIRMAGFGLPQPPFSLTIGGQTLTSPVTPSNSSTAPDSITILGIGYSAGTLQAQTGVACNSEGDTMICLSSPASDSIDKFFSGGTFVSDRKYITINGVEFLELATSGHDQSSRRLKLASPYNLSMDYDDGTPVYIIQAITYSIDTSTSPCSTSNPCLWANDLTGLRGNYILAEGIEDIQFAYGIDANPYDGKIDYSGSYTTSAFLNDPSDPSSIIAVRVNVVARTRNVDTKGLTFNRICPEDRSGDSNCTDNKDGYRRRSLSKVIMLRNPRQGV